MLFYSYFGKGTGIKPVTKSLTQGYWVFGKH
mgnify:CR=1 FL=1